VYETNNEPSGSLSFEHFAAASETCFRRMGRCRDPRCLVMSRNVELLMEARFDRARSPRSNESPKIEISGKLSNRDVREYAPSKILKRATTLRFFYTVGKFTVAILCALLACESNRMLEVVEGTTVAALRFETGHMDFEVKCSYSTISRS
jgi:hypothetical protein